MPSWFPSLADRMRRALGLSGAGKGAGHERDERRSGADLLRRKRAKVAMLALGFGCFSAVIDLPLPAEDFYRAVRAELRSRPAPQNIAFIAIDDKTVNALGGVAPGRITDSEVIDTLFSLGVEKVAFDRAHAAADTPAANARFAATLARHKGKVWLGVVPQHEVGSQVVEQVVPREEFRGDARVAAMNGLGSPFGLSVSFPTSVMLDGRPVPSLSAALAGYAGPARWYRPDYAFDQRTVPSYSYLDIVERRVPAEALAGKSVIIGEAFYESGDFYLLPLRNGKIPGGYFHIMGAHTLARGVPVDVMWFPAMLIVAAACAAVVFDRTKTSRTLILTAIALIAPPFVLDDLGINLDIMSALLALLAAAIGFQRIDRKYYSADVDAMTTSAISSDRPSEARDVYALKIASLAEMSEEWSPREIGDFVNTLIAYVKGPGEVGDVAFERDLLVWLAPRMDAEELERHADGLALMLKTVISHDWQSTETAPALGVDTNYDLPVALRIKKAMQAADEAATRGVRFIINDAAHLEARNQRLELIRVLEKGLRHRDIGVAYQPKIDLASGRIVGAETLIRWRPDGGDFVNPQDLVLAAEAGDRINELTLVVLETALQEARQAIALDPRFKLAVNMSAKSLSDTHLLFDMMTLLGRYQFPTGLC